MTFSKFQSTDSSDRRTPQIASLLLIFTLIACSVSADVFYVGDGAGCTNTSINNVLLAAAFNPGPDEIRVARNRVHNNQYIHLTDWDPGSAGALTIVGGFDDCTDTTPSGTTTLTGRASDPVFEIDTSSTTSQVTLRNLRIEGATGGDAGVLIEGSSTVAIERCTITGNEGGGVVALSGATVTIDYFTSIDSNTGLLGGGVYCNNATVTSSGIIEQNAASSSGGGVFADAGCDLSLEPGAWIEANQAQWGGGIYATGGASVSVDGRSALDGGLVVNNTATSQGGGIYANGVGTQVTLFNAHVSSNQAATAGGGIFATNQATVVLDRITGDCLNDDPRCTRLTANRLTTFGDGSAAYAENGANIEVAQTFVESNHGLDNGGFLFFASGSGTMLKLEGAQIWNNGTVSLFQSESSAVLRAAFVSAANNINTLSADPRLAQVNSSGNVQLYSSAFWDTDGVASASGGSVSGDCLIVDDTTGLGSVSFLENTDPMFIDPAGGDLQLRTDSPAIDFCDTAVFSPNHFDLAHQPRGYDHPASANGAPGPTGGIYDLGAYEARDLFSDGFESGDTGAWSATVP